MKRLSFFVFHVVLAFGLCAQVHAALTTIGTADYDGGSYNLIYENDSINGGLVWLDYTGTYDTSSWQNQMNWAAGLGAQLTVNLDPMYTTTIDWDTGWRLPITDESKATQSGGFGWSGPDGSGNYDYWYGYNMVNSEMGHLFYESLGNKGYYATDGTHPQAGWGLTNTGDFDNFLADGYWSGTEYSPGTDGAWFFLFGYGDQYGVGKHNSGYALAVLPGDVSAVPIPGAVWLLGSAMAGLGWLKRSRRRHG